MMRTRNEQAQAELLVRSARANDDYEFVLKREDGTVVQVGDTPVTGWVRVGDLIRSVPQWGRIINPNRLLGASARGDRWLCPHCCRWRTMADLTADPESACVGVTPRPGTVYTLPGHR